LSHQGTWKIAAGYCFGRRRHQGVCNFLKLVHGERVVGWPVSKGIVFVIDYGGMKSILRRIQPKPGCYQAQILQGFFGGSSVRSGGGVGIV
jgi:hypothetical protein